MIMITFPDPPAQQMEPKYCTWITELAAAIHPPQSSNVVVVYWYQSLLTNCCLMVFINLFPELRRKTLICSALVLDFSPAESC